MADNGKPEETSKSDKPGETSKSDKPGETSKSDKPGETSESDKPGETSESDKPEEKLPVADNRKPWKFIIVPQERNTSTVSDGSDPFEGVEVPNEDGSGTVRCIFVERAPLPELPISFDADEDARDGSERNIRKHEVIQKKMDEYRDEAKD